MKKILFHSTLLFLFLFLFLNPIKVKAVEYDTDYDVDYFLSESQNSISSRVRFGISITNLKSDTYVKRFSLVFPKSFQIKNVTAAHSDGEIRTNVTEDTSFIKIDLELEEPNTGSGSQNNIILEFDQENLFLKNGNVWEVILPTVESKESSRYNVTVHLPANTDKTLSIAKPKPDLIRNNQIIWRNPRTKTIYAVFGDKQYYEMRLNYNLQNTKLTPVYTEVAFPPDTQYQKTYVTSIKPKPSFVYIDSDGNYIGRYYLKPKERQTITYKGTVEILNEPRTDNINFIRGQYTQQKKYLLTGTNEWNIKSIEKIKNPKTISEIYYFTVKALQYDYDKLTKNNRRLGAEGALTYPNQAVCTEFADLFVATARENGIAAREIEGYGFSNDDRLRPLSLTSDVLHAWAEYYDTTRNSWIPVDPTWENTSGIDYYSSFDLNHIVFAIHGKDPSYPLPAGAYKISETKDISIESAAKPPKIFSKLIVDSVEFPHLINNKESYKLDVNIKNEGNIYEWDVPIEIKSKSLNIVSSKNIVTLLPYENKTISFQVKALTNGSVPKDMIEVLINGDKQYTQEVKVVPAYYDYSIKALFIGIPLGLIIVSIVIYRKRWK